MPVLSLVVHAVTVEPSMIMVESVTVEEKVDPPLVVHDSIDIHEVSGISLVVSMVVHASLV